VKHLIAVLAAFFLVSALLPAQENIPKNIPGTNIVVLSPIAATRTAMPPPRDMKTVLSDFHRHYQDELYNLPTSDWPPDLWWITVMLMPDEGRERWLIKITALKEEKGAKIIVITQIPIPAEKATFDSAAEAKKAAEKTQGALKQGAFLIGENLILPLF